MAPEHHSPAEGLRAAAARQAALLRGLGLDRRPFVLCVRNTVAHAATLKAAADLQARVVLAPNGARPILDLAAVQAGVDHVVDVDASGSLLQVAGARVSGSGEHEDLPLPQWAQEPPLDSGGLCAVATSGSGPAGSKLVAYRWEACAMQAKVTVERILSRAAPAGGRVRFVAASSIGHAYNLNGLFAAFAADAEICLPAGACQLAQTLAEPPACGCEATVLFATPQGYGALLEHEVVRSGELRSRLREHALPFYAFSAGCPLPAGTAEGVEELLGARVMQNFGTSEVGVIAAEEVDPGDCGPPCKRPHLAQERGGDASADKGVPWGQLELRPPGGGRLLPHGAEGEVAIKVPWCSDGYLVNQRLLPHPDAPFVRTGDAGRVVLRSPGGRASLFLMQRLWAPLEVRRGGLRLLLQAYEVEEALLRANPEALGAAALQGPDGKLFCVVACPMEPRLDGWLQPDKLLRVDRLPTSPAGKILYSTLRELLLLD